MSPRRVESLLLESFASLDGEVVFSMLSDGFQKYELRRPAQDVPEVYLLHGNSEAFYLHLGRYVLRDFDHLEKRQEDLVRNLARAAAAYNSGNGFQRAYFRGEKLIASDLVLSLEGAEGYLEVPSGRTLVKSLFWRLIATSSSKRGIWEEIG